MKLSTIAMLSLIAGYGNAAAAPSPSKTIVVGSLTLTYCNYEYDGYCGTIAQPLDRTGHLPGTLTIGFEFYPHSDKTQKAQGVILAQEGGPGYSTTGSRDGYIRLFTPLRDHRDILLIDKRGTGRSSFINCPALQHAYNPTTRDVEECGKQLGPSAWFYRSADAAHDVAAVMAALQLGPADYYGDSYATWFGQVLAVLHPEILRTLILDSAYPVIDDRSNTEVNSGRFDMEKACQRSAPCAALGGSARDRFVTLLQSVRANPIHGVAPGENGFPRHVIADPGALFLIVANAGNSPITWRDLDAAGRAWMGAQDPTPLLRLVAEARDSYSGGGPAEQFSVGLADAVQCAEYGTNFNMNDDRNRRQKQYARSLAWLQTHTPNAFSPFELDDAIHSQMNAEVYNTCLPWPLPAAGVTPGQPIPPNATFPNLPVLVLSGELDTVTSPTEGAAVAKLFPNATHIITRNLTHESAIGDAGVFTPPNGQDLAQCVGPIVRNFVATGGTVGDTSCVAHIRPIRTVPAFATSYTTVAPAQASPGNQTDATGLVLASAIAETVGDALARYYVTTGGNDAGLRGGNFTLASWANGYIIKLNKMKWTNDLTVSGTLKWDQLSGAITASTSFSAPGHAGTVDLAWNDQQTEAVARLNGTIDGAVLAAQRVAP